MKPNSIIVAALFSGIVGFSSCKSTKPTAGSITAEPVHPTLYATLFQQEAAEYNALCLQAYNVAALRLEEASKHASIKPQAVILDIDETVLNNIPYQAEVIKKNLSYPAGWAEWMEQASAEPLAGVVAFLLKAKEKGIAVFYVSNRKNTFKQATIRNLKEKNLPFADEDHVLLRTTSNEKESRRQKVMEQYNVIMLIGDNLGDFDGIFEGTNAEKRRSEVMDNAANFGTKWIVLPNAVYGNWVDVLPGYRQGMSNQEFSDSLKIHLKSFR